jgi:hypothetical protein
MGYTPASFAPPGDFGSVNAFAPAGNGYASQNEMLTIYDRPPAERTALMDRHVKYVGFATMLSSMGFTGGASLPTVGHYENPWLVDPVVVGSIITASTGAGTTVTIELASASMYDTGVTSGGSARKASYPIKGDVIELFDRTQVWVSAKDVTTDPHQLDLTPLDSTVDLAGKITAADAYGILYNLFAEGSGLPPGRAPRIAKYTNTFAIGKTAWRTTGSELTNSVYHEVIPGNAGSAGSSIYMKIEADQIRRHEENKSGLLLFGQAADNLTELVTESDMDTPVTSTEGLIDFGLTSGTTDTYPVGSYSTDELDDISTIYYDLRSTTTRDVCTWDGPDVSIESENAFTNVLQQNLAPFINRLIDGYGSMMDGGYHEMLDSSPQESTISFGYKVIEKGGLIFHMKRLSEFNDIRKTGTSDYEYRNYRMVTPINWMKDAITGVERPSIGYEWKELDGYSRENVFDTIAGAGPGGRNSPFGRAVHENDTLVAFLLCELAGHWALGSSIVMQIPA